MNQLIQDLFRVDNLSVFIGIFIGIFTLLSIIYSAGFMSSKRSLGNYYLFIILTLVASLGAVFSDNLIVFIVF